MKTVQPNSFHAISRKIKNPTLPVPRRGRLHMEPRALAYSDMAAILFFGLRAFWLNDEL